MQFTIITVCRNPGEQMRSAIKSVLAQKYPAVEYIVVDGDSTDGTAGIVGSYGASIAKFVSEPDRGLYDALNKGVRLATGDVVGFLHADDLYRSNAVLSAVADVFVADQCDSVYGDLEYVDKQHPEKVVRYWQSGAFRPQILRRGWMPPHPTFFVKREIYERVRMPNGEYFDTSLKIAADYDFMMRLLGKYRISTAYLPQVLVRMRLGGESNRSLKNIIRKSREDYLVMRRNQIGGCLTLLQKNLSKLPQFFERS